MKLSDEFIQKPLRISESRNTPIYLFESQKPGVNEFSIDDAAAIHDRAMAWLHDVHGTSEASFRRSLVEKLPEYDDDFAPNILVTACGAGNDFPYLFSRFPNAQFWIQDFAEEMLVAAIERHGEVISGLNLAPLFFVSDAAKLPLPDSYFDIVFHFGGINLYRDVPAGVAEQHRVAKIGGTVLFGDEGMAPWMRESELGQVLAKNNPLYLHEAPLAALPTQLTDFSLEYRFNNCFYLVSYKKSEEVHLNLDAEHAGRRGGSLRTRFYGVLEGVKPELRDELYAEASKRGTSRVAAIEEAITAFLQKES